VPAVAAGNVVVVIAKEEEVEVVVLDGNQSTPHPAQLRIAIATRKYFIAFSPHLNHYCLFNERPLSNTGASK